MKKITMLAILAAALVATINVEAQPKQKEVTFINPKEQIGQEGCVSSYSVSGQEYITHGREKTTITVKNRCDCCKEVKVSVKVKGEAKASTYKVHVKDYSTEVVTSRYDVALSELTLKIISEKPCRSIYGMEYCKD